MVGGEHHHDVAVLDLREYEGQEIRQVAVQPVVHVLDLNRLGAVGFADAARCVEADVQQIGHLVVPEFVLRDGLLGQPQHGGVARRGVEQAFEIAGQLQASRAVQVLFFPVLARQRDIVVARVEVAAAFEQRAPLGRDVREVVTLAVAAVDPLGNRGRIVGRGHPVAARRVEPEDLPGASGHHHGRHGFGGYGHERLPGACRRSVSESVGAIRL